MTEEQLMKENRQEARTAFDNAVLTGRLTTIKGHKFYAGDYMYMGKDPAGQKDLFKHIMTREYIA